MTADKPTERKRRKRKNRRKNSSKCAPTSPFALEKTPFKDKADNGININGSLAPNATHIFDRERVVNIQGFTMLHNVLSMDVGVNIVNLVNEKIEEIMDLQSMIVELDKLLLRHKRLDTYKRLAFEEMTHVFTEAVGKETFLRKEVYHSLYFILRNVLPASLLGSKLNFRAFMKSVRRIVYGNHHQCLSLSSVVHGLKVSHVSWLQKCLPSNSLRLSILARLVKWLLLYVQHVIRRSWTICIHSSKELVYCDKKKWPDLKRIEIKGLLSSGKIKIVPEGSKDQKKLISLGQTHFHIKKHGLRPITRYEKPSCDESIVRQKDAKMLLYQWAYYSGCINNPFAPRLENILHQSLLRIKKLRPNPVHYYFVRTDVKDAFGSINHYQMLTTLQSLASDFLPRDCVMQAWEVKRGKKLIKVFECDKMPLPRFLEMSKHRMLEKGSVRRLLDHIRNHVHQLGTSFGEKVYKICQGLPQGMHLSAILCEIYYNTLDKKHLQAFLRPACDEMFVRYCDDYLLITPKRERAEEFLKKVVTGFSDFGVTFNAAKTITNLNGDVSVIPFCGLYINLESFAVRGNFDNYLNQNIAASLSLKKTQKLGNVLLSRMKVVLKLSPMMVDPKLNSKQDGAQNIYEVALFMAFRFCAYVKSFFPSKNINQNFILKCVKLGEKALKKRVLKAISSNSGGDWINRAEIKWLVYQAFYSRMKRNGNWFSKVLRFMKCTCDKILGTLTSCQSQILLDVVKISIPKPFSSMH